MAKIVAGAGAQQRQDVTQRVAVFFVGIGFVHRVGRRSGGLGQPRDMDGRHVVGNLLEPLGHGRHRQNDVHHAGRDGAARHGVVFGVFGLLRERDAALFLDARQAHRPVRPAARQHDADRARGVHVGQRAEEFVDGDARALRLAGGRHA